MSYYPSYLNFTKHSWPIIFFAAFLVYASVIFAATFEEYEERIQFSPGRSSGIFSQELKPNGYYRYILRAKAFQEMTVSIRSKGGKAFFYVWGLTPELGVLTGGQVYDKWIGGLPKTCDYKIGVFAEKEKTRFTLEVTIVDKKVRKEPRPTRKEAEKVCGFVAASHSGTVKGKSALDMYVHEGETDINNDGKLEKIGTCMSGTMGGDCFSFIGRDGKEINIDYIGVDDLNLDHYPLAERILPFGGRIYRVYFREDSRLFPSYIAYVDPGNWELPVCKFSNTVMEQVAPGIEDRAFCAQLITSDHPQVISINENHDLIIEDQEKWELTKVDKATQVDIDNDGHQERVVLLKFESGAARGCRCQYFDLLNEAKDGILHTEKREQLLEMQGVRDLERFPCPHCTGNKADWFVYQGVTYFENKYPGEAPKDDTQTFHSVSYLKNGEIRNVCDYLFKVKTEVGAYFSLE